MLVVPINIEFKIGKSVQFLENGAETLYGEAYSIKDGKQKQICTDGEGFIALIFWKLRMRKRGNGCFITV